MNEQHPGDFNNTQLTAALQLLGRSVRRYRASSRNLERAAKALQAAVQQLKGGDDA